MCLAALAGSAGCRLFEPSPPGTAAAVVSLQGQPTGEFSTMRRTWADALNDLLNRRPVAEQPLDFPHNTHIKNDIACEVCHEGVDKGPVAGIPGLRTCMICHAAIATDRPRIQQITKMYEMGIDLAWQRVYGFSNDDNVKFNHAPHIRAKVECATCHGDVGAGTVATRNVDHTMGFCVNCHNERKAPVDCLTCHF